MKNANTLVRCSVALLGIGGALVLVGITIVEAPLVTVGGVVCCISLAGFLAESLRL